MGGPWTDLVARVRELNDISHALRLLHWDQAVMMPGGGGAMRARSMATIETIAHERLTDPALADTVVRLSDDGGLDDAQRASVRVLRRDIDLATKVPGDLVRALAEVRGLAYQAWAEAQPANDFGILASHLDKLIELKRQEADALGWHRERYDALLDLYEPGFTTERAMRMFDELVAGLLPIVESATAASGDVPPFVSATFDETDQMNFCTDLVRHLGFDAGAGRLDRSPHPFTTHIGPGDVRQTTRTRSNELLGAVYAALHETGHALYEQGLPDELLDLPAGTVPSLGMHESQSRLWENQVGRGRPFCEWLLGELARRWPDAMEGTGLDEFYRGVNHVARTPIRVTADEVTYNLHIAHRFELELALFRGDLDVGDAPEAWNAAFERLVGIVPPNDASGILQDMHWSIGALGYFPTYTIGNLYAAALYERADADIDDLAGDLRRGDGAGLLEWLRTHVHSHAYLLPARELMTEIVGDDPGPGPLLRYLDEKFSALQP